jgi:hypothetical protein
MNVKFISLVLIENSVITLKKEVFTMTENSKSICGRKSSAVLV